MFEKRIWINRTMNFLENNQEKINWKYLSGNPNAIHLLEKNLDKINRWWYWWSWRSWWYWLSKTPYALDLLKKSQYKIDWECLSKNPNAISILEKNPENIYWPYLSENPNAISILEKNIYKIDWFYLSHNPNAIHLLEKNPDKIYWPWLCENVGVNKLNYKRLTERMDIFKDELMAVVYHPDNYISNKNWI